MVLSKVVNIMTWLSLTPSNEWGSSFNFLTLLSFSRPRALIIALEQTFLHCSSPPDLHAAPFSPSQTSWTVSPHISSCKCQCPHTSGSFLLNIKQNNDDVLVYVSLSREFSKMVISFIMSRVCFCCGAVVKIVSASRGCIKKTHCSEVSTGPDLFPE